MPKNKVELEFELLPCPFCGGNASIVPGFAQYMVKCECGTHMFFDCEQDYHKTKLAWQKRANGCEVNNV